VRKDVILFLPVERYINYGRNPKVIDIQGKKVKENIYETETRDSCLLVEFLQLLRGEQIRIRLIRKHNTKQGDDYRAQDDETYKDTKI